MHSPTIRSPTPHSILTSIPCRHAISPPNAINTPFLSRTTPHLSSPVTNSLPKNTPHLKSETTYSKLDSGHTQFNYTTKMLLLKPIENKPTTTTPTVTLEQPLNPLYAPRPAAKGKCAVHLCSACHKIFVPVEGGMCIACECSWSWNVRGGGTNCDIGQLGA